MRAALLVLLCSLAVAALPGPVYAQQELFANNAVSTLAVAVNATDTTLVVQSGHGARFPAAGGGPMFWATLESGSTREIVQVTDRSADTLTVVRAQQGTTGASWGTGTTIEQRITASTLENFVQFQAATETFADSSIAAAEYWTGAAHAGLAAEKNLGALSTGLVVNTGGTPSTYGGAACTNQFIEDLSASGAPTCVSVDLAADVTGVTPVANGGTNLNTADDDNTIVGNGTTWQTKTLPSCSNATTSKLLYNTATNAWSCGTDQTAAVSIARLAADSAISVITKANLSGFAFTLSANTSYTWNCNLYTTANAATVGVQFAITFGGTVTAARGMFQGPGAATTLLWISDNSFPLDFNPTASQGNVAGMVTLSGTVEVSGTGGTLQFQHGSETATLTTVQRGSWCTVQ